MLAIGLDGYPRGWVVAAIRDGALDAVSLAPNLQHALDAYPGATSVGIDIPIGLPEPGVPRPADHEARALLGPFASSVFMTPPRAVIEASTHQDAIRLARRLGCPAPSAQAYALRNKILEVAPIAAADPRIFEVHPEVAFHALNDGPLRHRKRTWAGMHERLATLATQGIDPARDVPTTVDAPPDDVLDAVVTAWVAWHHATGRARSLPADQPTHPHHRIWYARPA